MENIYSTFDLDHPNPRKRLRPVEPYIELHCDLVTRFNFNSALICQINNCTARKLHPYSFSWELAQVFNYANPYQHRSSGPYPNLAEIRHRPDLGSVEILHPPTGTKGPSFACLYSQYKMGKWDSTYYLNSFKADQDYKYKALRKDTYQHRVQYFKQCLNNLLIKIKLNDIYPVIVFPKYIGCGLAKGDWKDYEPIIVNFCHQLKSQSPYTRVCIVNKVS